MIELPNLDDRSYADIVETAKRRIPVIFPEWTDFNEHDPGITIIEMFAWLKEMQQYYLNRISDLGYKNMLKLLGVDDMPAVPARAVLNFDNGNAPERLIKDTIAENNAGIPFVVEDEFFRAPFIIGDFYIDGETAPIKVTEILNDENADICPFSKSFNGAYPALYADIDEILSDSFYDRAELWFDISKSKTAVRNAPADGQTPPRDIVWEYSTESGFSPCGVLEDETFALSFSGKIALKTGRDFSANTHGGRLPLKRRIRAVLTYGGCEVMPNIRRISNNVCAAVQKKILCRCEELILPESAFFSVSNRLLRDGMYFVLVRTAGGWEITDVSVSELRGCTVTADLSSCKSKIADDGIPNVRVVIADRSFADRFMFFSSNGLPCQHFEFDLTDEPLTDDLAIMVMDREGSSEPFWQDFRYVNSLSSANEYERCFTYDRVKRLIVFGDNENGEAPAVGSDNIMVISCSVTKGAGGNLKRGNINSLNDGMNSYTVSQYKDAANGRNEQSRADMLKRLELKLGECVRAVTEEDYREVVMRTPGIIVADAKAIANYDCDFPLSSEESAANTVTIVTVPYSTEKFPIPDKRFLDAVKSQVEKYRLITTNVKVTPPIYVKVDIDADVVCDSLEVDKVRKRAEDVLKKELSISPSKKRIRFGEAVSEIDMISALCSVEGIINVKRIQLNYTDSRCTRDKYGRIIIPPHAAAYCGNVGINVMEA